jgi:hypothetical protein
VKNDDPMGVEIERIRHRLRKMKTEREESMTKLAESREIAEGNRNVRADAKTGRTPPDPPALYAP